MIRKKGIPLRVFLYALPPVLVLFYYISGVFTFPDLTLQNFLSHLTAVFREFYHPFKWANARTPDCLALGLLLWIFISSYVMVRYRNYQSGMEYGTEDWGDPFEVCARRADAEEKENRILSAHVAVARDGEKSPSNNNMLVIGSAGRYKTTATVMTNILRCNANYIILDVKGELMYKCGLYLKSQGYTIRCLNLKDQAKSDRYNPFLYIEKSEDLIRLIENIYDSLTPPDAMSSDPFWTDGAKMYLQSVFFYVWFMAKKEGRTGSFNEVLLLIDEETTPSGKPAGKDKAVPSKLEVRMREMEKRYGATEAVRYYRKLKEGARETVRSIVIIVNAKLKLCSTGGLRRIFSADDMHLREFATGVGGSVEKPSGRRIALFLCISDNDTSYNFICSMLYTQATEILCRMADEDFKDRGGCLPVPLEMWMDEFYAGARPHDTERLMGVIRSRHISMIPILQSVAQIKALFKSEKWEIIMDNCPVLLFMGAGAGALETHKYISELLGKMTIDKETDGKSGENESTNHARAGRELMTPSEVRRMDKKYMIIFMEGEYPIYDRKALPWEMPEEIVPFKAAMKLNAESPDHGYVHQVSALFDEESGEFFESGKKDAPPIREVRDAPPGMRRASLTEEEFLHLDLSDKKQDLADLGAMLKAYREGRGKAERSGSGEELPAGEKDPAAPFPEELAAFGDSIEEAGADAKRQALSDLWDGKPFSEIRERLSGGDADEKKE